jgi:organic radical activating enzyme
MRRNIEKGSIAMIKNTLLSLTLSAGLIIGSGVGFSAAQTATATCVCNAIKQNGLRAPTITYLGGNPAITKCSPCISYCKENYFKQAEADGGQLEAVINHNCVGG